MKRKPSYSRYELRLTDDVTAKETFEVLFDLLSLKSWRGRSGRIQFEVKEGWVPRVDGALAKYSVLVGD